MVDPRDPCGDQIPGTYGTTLHMRGKDRKYRKMVGRWLVDRGGKPVRTEGGWWTEPGGNGGLTVCFLHAKHSAGSRMVWCEWQNG